MSANWGMTNPFAPDPPAMTGMTVPLDGAVYRGVTFTNCIMVYSGGLPPILEGNRFIGCEWQLSGAALNTSDFLFQLITMGGEGLVRQFLGMAPLPPLPPHG
jgi:hypothetical protein